MVEEDWFTFLFLQMDIIVGCNPQTNVLQIRRRCAWGQEDMCDPLKSLEEKTFVVSSLGLQNHRSLCKLSCISYLVECG